MVRECPGQNLMHFYPRILSVTHKFWEQSETENIFVSSETHPLLVRAGGGGGGGLSWDCNVYLFYDTLGTWECDFSLN